MDKVELTVLSQKLIELFLRSFILEFLKKVIKQNFDYFS